jgi:hypothetical protein
MVNKSARTVQQALLPGPVLQERGDMTPLAAALAP